MTTSQEYLSNVQNLMDDFTEDGQVVVTVDSVKEAQLHLKNVRHKQKQLRLIKKEVRHTMKQMRSSYTAQVAEVGKPSLKSGIMAGFLGKKKLGKVNALQKENLRRQQNASLSPYETVIQLIDQSLLILDDLKLRLENWLIQNK